MKPELQIEINRLRHMLESRGLEFNLSEGAPDERIMAVERQIGFTLDENLKDLWRYTNGSNFDYWFAVSPDETMHCAFSSIDFAFQQWSAFVPYDSPAYDDYRRAGQTNDQRIRPIFINPRWFPVAACSDFSTRILFDADPTPTGVSGQIIVYQRDSDGMRCLASNFLEFFKKSNDNLPAVRQTVLAAQRQKTA